MKNIIFFLSENIHFLVIKFLVYLNRLLFVMTWKYRVTGLHTSGYSKEGIEQSDRKVLVHASAIRFLFFFFFSFFSCEDISSFLSLF